MRVRRKNSKMKKTREEEKCDMIKGRSTREEWKKWRRNCKITKARQNL